MPSTDCQIATSSLLEEAVGRPVVALAGPPVAATPRRSASPMRCTFPVGPFGISSTTTMRRGTLNGASCWATKS